MLSSIFKSYAKDFTVYYVGRKPNLPVGYTMRDMSEDYATMIKEELGEPIKKDSRVHIEYVPTQVFTEYVKYLYADDEEMPVQGIVYPSARIRGGVSVVLFYENKDCFDINDPNSGEKHLQLMTTGRVKIR
jgi:hypothetical protein